MTEKFLAFTFGRRRGLTVYVAIGRRGLCEGSVRQRSGGRGAVGLKMHDSLWVSECAHTAVFEVAREADDRDMDRGNPAVERDHSSVP